MKIGHQIIMGFLLMSLMVAAVGAYNISRYYESLHRIDQIILTNTREIELTGQLDASIQDMRLAYMVLIMETQLGKHRQHIVQVREKLASNVAAIHVALDSLESVAREQMQFANEGDEEDEISDILELKREVERFDAITGDLNGLLKTALYEQAHRLAEERIAPAVRDVMKISSRLRTDASSEMHAELIETREDMLVNNRISMFIFVGGVFLAIMFGTLLSRRITRNINQLLRVTELLGQGKLSSRSDVTSSDELGQISSAINQMAGGLRSAIVSRDDLAREIEIREQAEQERIKSEARFRTIFEASADTFMLLDSDGFIDCNQATLQMFGCTDREQFLGHHPSEFSPLLQPDGNSSSVAAEERIQEAYMRGSVLFEWTHCRLSGESFLAEVLLTSMPLDGKDILLASVRDITDRKVAERALKESEERIRLLLDSTAEAIYGIDREGKCFLANAACLEMLGYEDFSELDGKNMHELIHHSHVDGSPYAIEDCPVYQALETGKESHVDDEVIWRKNGSCFPVSYWTHPIYKKGRITGSVVAFLDITETIRTKQDLKKSHEYLRNSLEGTVSAVAKAVEARDPYTSGHQKRVAEIAVAIAHEMGLDADRIKGIYLGAVIHDIGKIQTPAEILSKPSRLSDIEYALIQSHAETGYNILKDIAFPWPVALIAWQHHERYNGSGYPQGLKGDEICLEARIVAVADVVEAMTNHRPYRAGLGIERALDEIRLNRGIFYDPEVCDACLKLFTEKDFTTSF